MIWLPLIQSVCDLLDLIPTPLGQIHLTQAREVREGLALLMYCSGPKCFGELHLPLLDVDIGEHGPSLVAA